MNRVMTYLLRTLWFLALLLPGWTWAQNSDVWEAKADFALRNAAGDQQPAIAQVKAQTPLTKTGQRSGPWTQVRTANGQVGWVHMFDLQKRASPAASARPASAGLMRTLTQAGKSTGGSATPTTLAGIRGLDAEDIQNASPNPTAVTQAEKLQVTAEEARQFASAAQLNPRPVDELPVLTLTSVTSAQQ